MCCLAMVEHGSPSRQSALGADAGGHRNPATVRDDDPSDGALVVAWCQGNTEALRTLIDRHRRAAFGLALRLCGNRERAEDLAQDAFVRALTHIHLYNTVRPFRPWLLRILSRIYIDRLRAGWEYPDETPPVPPTRLDTDSEMFVETLLASLSAQHRAILILRELAGLSYEELADYWHIPLGTVRSRLAHARAALKTAYLRMQGEVER